VLAEVIAGNNQTWRVSGTEKVTHGKPDNRFLFFIRLFYHQVLGRIQKDQTIE
jgi:hypothetical protein